MTCDCPQGESIPVSQWWGSDRNHRAEPHQLICVACGGGIDADDETQARVEHDDRECERTQAVKP